MELKKVNKRKARLQLVQRRAEVLTRQRIQMQEDERKLKLEEKAAARGETPVAPPVEELPIEAPVENAAPVTEAVPAKKGK